MSRVEAYRLQTGQDAYDEVVGNEAQALLRHPALKNGTKRLLGWLQAIQAGQALPENEPEAPHEAGLSLRYRCDGDVVMMFDYLEDAGFLLVLAFAPSAMALPTVETCRKAANRRRNWSMSP